MCTARPSIGLSWRAAAAAVAVVAVAVLTSPAVGQPSDGGAFSRHTAADGVDGDVAVPLHDSASASTDGAVDPDDGTACYNGCSGHGVCRQYTCHCHPGFTGEDCSIALTDSDTVIPLLSAGHFNLTVKGFQKQVRATKRRVPLLVAGFSSRACDKCVAVEAAYAEVSPKLGKLSVAFGRVDVNQRTRQLAVDNGVTSLPALVFVKGMVGHVYTGPHTPDAIMLHTRKQLASPMDVVTTVDALAAALDDKRRVFGGRPFTLAVAALGRDAQHSDEYEDVEDAFKQLAPRCDVFTAQAGDALMNWMLTNGWLRRTPALVLIRHGYGAAGAAAATTTACSEVSVSADGDAAPDAACALHAVAGDRKVLTLEDFFDEGVSLAQWVLRESVPPVAELTPANFGLYEAMKQPMVLLFLDLRGFVGGLPLTSRSGTYRNEALLRLFDDVAREEELADRLVFVYTDGIAHADKMRALGLQGGEGHLPALALNVRDGRRLAFPPDQQLTAVSVRRFLSHFLTGHLSESPGVLRGRTPPSAAPVVQETVGVRERWKPADAAVVTVVAADNFTSVVMDDTRDVLVLFTAGDCDTCLAMTPYYRRVGVRFQELQLSDVVVVARMDVSAGGPPPVDVALDTLPMLVLFPAFDKRPPHPVYSGVSKVGPIMRWVEANSGRQLHLPDLPQFSADDAALYKQQLTEREERRRARLQGGGNNQNKKQQNKSNKKKRKTGSVKGQQQP